MPTTTVLVLTRNLAGFYGGEVLAGLVRAVETAGGRVVVVQAVEPEDDAHGLSEAEFDLPVALDLVDVAVSIAPASTRPYLETLRARGIPVVLASAHVPGFEAPVVTPDNLGGVRAGLEHLMAHGHTRIAMVADPSQHDFRERVRAWRTVMTEHGLPTDEDLVLRASDYSELGGSVAARQLLAAAERPTAVMAATDLNALGLVATVLAAGLRVPQDLAVVGFDDVDASRFGAPSLSSVHQRFDAVGHEAGRLAMAMARGETVPPVEHSPTSAVVLPRGSCGCRTDLIDVGASPGPPVSGLSVGSAELVHMLHAVLDDREHGILTPDAVEVVVQAVGEILAAPDGVADTTVVSLVHTLQTLAPRPQALQRLAAALTEYLQRLLAVGGGDGRDHPAATSLAAAVWQLRTWLAEQQGRRREAAVTEHGTVVTSLLRAQGGQARSLEWLTPTHVRTGVLALWQRDAGDGMLTVAGVHPPGDPTGPVVGETTHVTRFPPQSLITRADASRGEVCVVVPVRAPGQDWGLLAVVGVLNSESPREVYRDWSDVLCVALEAENLERAVRTSEQRYAHAARASNDGLWEIDLDSGRMYLSARCRDLLGLARDDETTLDIWTTAVHPDDAKRVGEAMASAIARVDVPVVIEYRVRRPGGGYQWVLSRGLGVADPGMPTARLVGSLSDIDQRKELEERLRRAALYDSVTGLPNRRLFLERLESAIELTRRRPGSGYAVVFLDLDGFKLVNDSLGHLMGDELLRVVGERLRSDLRTADTAARFGGDELAVLLCDPVPGDVLTVAHRIQQRVAAPVVLGGHEISISASIGIATSEAGYTDAEDVLRDADIAMYHAKETERGTVTVFDREMHTRATQRLTARAELRAALGEHQFVVHYQPVVALDGSPLGQFEALIRWQHPERGLLPPGEFLPQMEEDGSVVTLGAWVLDEVCSQIARWHEQHGTYVGVAVNLSHREFWSEALADTVAGALERHQVPASSLILEITERVIMADPSQAGRIMDHLRAAGAQLHLDDFGTGQSSLNALRTFPVDTLKVDGSFVRELGVVEQTTKLVGIIVAMGEVLGLEVVAEHVESQAQATHLRGLGCTFGQGWLYAPALPADEAGALIGRRLGAGVLDPA